MYEAFFHLREKPFSLLPDPGFLFLSQKHQEALTLLEYGLLNQAGFIVLTGEIGSGKTTLMRYLLDRLDKDVIVGLISHTHKSLGDLNHWICSAFDIRTTGDTAPDRHRAIIDFLIEGYAKGKRVLLIVDEAQNLGVEKLEELRLLSNINADKDLILQLMLLGQPQLRDLLQNPDLEQFVQRVSASYHLGRLDATETANYIQHRISVAGGKRQIFTKDARHAVHHYSGGVPRIINLLCDTALVYAYGAGAQQVTGTVIDDFVSSHAPHLLVPILGDVHHPRPREASPEEDTIEEVWCGSESLPPSHVADDRMPLPANSLHATPPSGPIGQVPRRPEIDFSVSKLLENDANEPISNRESSFFELAGPQQQVQEERPNRTLRTLAAISLLLVVGVAALWFGGSDSKDSWTFIQSQFMPPKVPTNDPTEVPPGETDLSEHDLSTPSTSTDSILETTDEAPQVLPTPTPEIPSEQEFKESLEGSGPERRIVEPQPPTPEGGRQRPTTGGTAAEVPTRTERRTVADSSVNGEEDLTLAESSTLGLDAMVPELAGNDSRTLPEPTLGNDLAELNTMLHSLSLEMKWLDKDRLVANLGQSVTFGDGSTEINAPAAERIREIAEILKDYEGIRIHVVGHTDSSGRPGVNRWLSDRRAELVAASFIDLGISPERITHEGRGRAEMKIDLEQEKIQGPWINRRIELEFAVNSR